MIASDILKRRNLEHTTWIEGGIVSSRVALLLRSAEIKPLFFDLIPGVCELRVAFWFGRCLVGFGRGEGQLWRVGGRSECKFLEYFQS